MLSSSYKRVVFIRLKGPSVFLLIRLKGPIEEAECVACLVKSRRDCDTMST